MRPLCLCAAVALARQQSPSTQTAGVDVGRHERSVLGEGDLLVVSEDSSNVEIKAPRAKTFHVPRLPNGRKDVEGE